MKIKKTTIRKTTAIGESEISLVAVSRDFFSILFHESNPPGPLMDSLQMFCFMIRFRLDIRILSSKNTTTGSVCQRGVEIC